MQVFYIMEIWKQFDDLEISNFGNFKKNGLPARQYGDRYLFVTSMGKVKTVHRLVALVFIPNPQNKPQVNHINGIKTDNRVENLEWCTASENGKHAYDNGLSKAKKGNDHVFFGKRGGETVRAKKVLDTKTGIIYDSLKDCWHLTPYSYKNCSRQLIGNRSNRTGFVYV